MELLDVTLEEKFQTCGGHVDVGTVLSIAVQIVGFVMLFNFAHFVVQIDILSYIHSKAIIYRDVKPEVHFI